MLEKPAGASDQQMDKKTQNINQYEMQKNFKQLWLNLLDTNEAIWQKYYTPTLF